MPQRFPLLAKILCWFLLNLALLAAAGWLVFEQQMRLGFDSLLAGRAGDRIRSVGELALREINESDPQQWDAILAKFGSAYPAEFHLVTHEGIRVAGQPVQLPPEVAERLAQIRGPRRPPPDGRARFPGGPPDRPVLDYPNDRGDGPRNGPPNGRPNGPPNAFVDDPPDGLPEGPPNSSPDGPPPRPQNRRGGDGPGPPPRFGGPPPRMGPDIIGFVKAGNPTRYWVLLHAPLERRTPGAPTALVLIFNNLSGGGLILDYSPFLWGGAAALGFSVLFWIPLIRSITRSIGTMRDATVSIADGRFDVRVAANRRDELGSLGTAINAMSERLEGFLTGQRRFLSDVAHELCAPLSRLQVALGILETRAAEADRSRLLDLREEVDHMAELVSELLSFSRAALGSGKAQMGRVEVRELLEKVVHRESMEGMQIEIDSPEELGVQGEPELLQRALGNLLRNAIRYAAEAGPITITAKPRGGEVEIDVADCGPGVPQDVLPRLFDPFFRVDTSRARETGGVGLGLSIARTCVEACGGTIAARNLDPHGLCVTVTLLPADSLVPGMVSL